jgi:RNA polymerase sigma factor (sigma-70 family)
LLDYCGREAQTVGVGLTATVPGLRHRLARKPARAETDDLLVARVRDGDAGAFEAIYDRYARGVFAFCVQMLGSREAGEDALQTTFASAYRALRTGGNAVSLRPWLYTIARNRCLSDLRCRPGAEPGELAIDHPAFDDVADQVHRREELREILADLQRLPADQRAALVLLELGDHSHKDIAAVLGVRCEKVKALVFQAREGLARGRRARDYPCTEVHEQLATLGGKVPRRGMVRAHIDRCVTCAAFELEVRRQRSALALVLPVALSAELKSAVLGSALGGGGAIAACAGTSGGGALLAGSGTAGVAAVGADGAAVGVGSLGASGIAAKVLTVAAIATGAAGVTDVTGHAPWTRAPRLARSNAAADARRSSTVPTIVSMRRASTTPVSWSPAGASSSPPSLEGRQVGASGAAPTQTTTARRDHSTGSPSGSAAGGPLSPAGTMAAPPSPDSADGGGTSPTGGGGSSEAAAIASPTMMPAAPTTSAATTSTADAQAGSGAPSSEPTAGAQAGSGAPSSEPTPADTTTSPESGTTPETGSPTDPSPSSTAATPAVPTVSTSSATSTTTTPIDTPTGDGATSSHGNSAHATGRGHRG